MQITAKDSAQTFEIRAKETVIQLGEEFQIGELVLPGAGEYEVAGVMAQVVKGGIRLEAEDMAIGYLRRSADKLSEHALEEIGSVDILFFPIGDEGFSPKEAIAYVAQAEAPVMVPMATDAALLEQFCASEVTCEQQDGPLKITRTQLPSEGSRVIVFGGTK